MGQVVAGQVCRGQVVAGQVVAGQVAITPVFCVAEQDFGHKTEIPVAVASGF
jgi:hypothetical protein